MGDLTISGSNFSIDCYCSRWDIDNYQVIIETWLTKSNLISLRDNIVPGAAGELYKILGKPHFYDMTWEDNNTIKLIPDINHQLSSIRNNTTLYVKNLTDNPKEGPSGWINVKIEGYISGSVLI